MQVKIRRGFHTKKPSFNKPKTKKIFTGKKKELKGSKLALLALGLLFFIFILGKSVSILNNLTKSFSSDILSKKQYSLDFKSSINIAFKTNAIWLLNYQPIDKKIVILKIPDATYLELPRDFGFWRVGSIYDLGQEEVPQIGSELLKESLSKLLGLPVDGFITLQSSSQDNLEKMLLSWHNNPFKIISFLRLAKTDLSPIETYRLFNELSKIRPDKIISLDLEQTDLTRSKLLPDSSRVLGVDTVNLDLFVREKMSDEQISREGVSIAIFNATPHPGLAQDASRIITNLGGNPIIVTNTESYTNKSLIVSSSSSNSYKRFAQIFAPWCLKSKCEVNDPKVNSSRAKINIVLGEDFYTSHYSR